MLWGQYAVVLIIQSERYLFSDQNLCCLYIFMYYTNHNISALVVNFGILNIIVGDSII